MVQRAWEASKDLPLMAKINACGSELMEWGAAKACRFTSRIGNCKDRMRMLRSKSDPTSLKLFEETKKEYNSLLNKQEAFWKPRAKYHWLKRGDCNA